MFHEEFAFNEGKKRHKNVISVGKTLCSKDRNTTVESDQLHGEDLVNGFFFHG